MAAPEHNDLALYVHWPWCVSKCPYCDFNSHVTELTTVIERAWERALIAEIYRFASEIGPRKLGTIFFGGGTPSLMAPDTAGRVIEAARARWPAGPDLEITLEANPSSAEAGRFRAYREAGVNRLSLGVQSFDDAALRFLGRAHDAGAARKAIEAAAETFERFSFDLIYARPGQGEATWRAELAQALDYAPTHLSVYQLTIEPGTAFHKDRVAAAPEEGAVALFEATGEILGAAGLPAYEVSNHARPGEESRHNLAYWQGGDYVGVGPGAHGRLTAPGDGESKAGATDAIRQIPDPDRWLRAVTEKGVGTAHRETLDASARCEEIVMMGLRLTDGLDRTRFRARTGHELEDAFTHERIQRLIEGGFLELDRRGLRATAEGRLRLNAVIGALVG